MSFQGVFNTRLSEKIGLFESNVFVQGTAFVLSLIVLLVAGSGNLRALPSADIVSKLGGAIGVVITITVMLSIKHLPPTVAISTILIAQLLVAAVIDAFGLFGQEKLPLHWQHYVGSALMIGGVLLFKWDFK